MTESALHHRHACPHCGGTVEFPAEMAGTSVACPHCGDPLDLLEPESPAAPAPEPPGTLTASALALAFRGPIQRPRPPLRYLLALGLATAVMLVLPLLYLALVAVVGGGVALFGFRWFRWLNPYLGRELFYLEAALYAVGLAAGLIILFFLLKPFLARPARRRQPLALNPAAEPLLFAFLGMVCDTVGAPHPVRVDVDCRLNASAGYRGGLSGLVRGDLVLTLGLPLATALELPQLAGVLAHEFGHFSQRLGMGASAVVRAINAWLARVAYERDGWDAALESWVRGETRWRFRLLGTLAQLGVWPSRTFLKILRHAGHAVACGLLREMERHADRCEVAVAGSAAFAETRRRLRVLHETGRAAYQAMRAEWERTGTLPENLPRHLAAAGDALEPTARQAILDRAEVRAPRWSDTHPPDEERIRRAEAEAAAGLFTLVAPATALFADFDVVARQATRLHYEDALGLEPSTFRLAAIPLAKPPPRCPNPDRPR